MADNNPFADFDEAVPTITATGPADEDDNPFSQFDAEQPPQPAAASQPAAQPAPAPAMPGASVIGGDEVRTGDRGIQDLLDNFKVANAREGTDKLNESRGRDFVQKVGTFLQYEAELIKGVPSGAVSGVGTALSGAGAVKAGAEANIATFANQQIAVMDRIDAGELKAADQLHPSLAGYGQMSAAQRELTRERVRRQFYGFTPTPVQQQGLSKAGAALKEHAKTILPAAPGYEEVWTRQIGEGLGSMAVGLPVALVGGAGAGGLLYGAMGAGEAAERAIEYDRKEKAAGRAGLTQDDIIRSAIWGVGPGATDVLPVEMLLGRLRVPPALAKLGAKTIGRIGGQAFLRMAQQAVVEGSQEGAQQFLQNMIESRYDAEQTLGEGVLPSAGVGAGVGGVAQAGKEMAQLALRRFAGRRGPGPGPGASQPAPAGAPQPTAPGQAQPPAMTAPQAASPATPATGPAAAPAPQGAESQPATPIDRAPLRQQFDQFLAMEDELAAIPDDTEAPEPLRNNLIAAEDQLIAQFQASGLPGDSLADGVRPIESFDDIKRAFDEATPEEIDDYWQGGQTIGAAATGAAVRTGQAPQGGAGGQVAARAGAPSAVATTAPTQAGLVGDPVRAASFDRMMQASVSRLAAAENTIKVVMKSAQLMEKDVANLRRLNAKAQALRSGLDERNELRKAVDNLMFFGDPQEIRNLRADRLEGRRDETIRIGQQLQRDYNLAVRQAEGIIEDLEMLKGKRDEALGLSAPSDPTAGFIRMIASDTPRSEWAAALGVTEQALAPHIDRAIEKDLLRRDRNGVIRRNARELEGFEPEEEIVTQKLEQAEESGYAALVAPGVIGGDNVAMTPAGLDKIAQLQKVVDQALAKILPREVRLEVVDNIKIGRLAREDELLSLAAADATTQTPEFKRWFGGSKAVDAEGEPLVVYHGTRADISAFDKALRGANTGSRAAREGFFFSANPTNAEGFTALSHAGGANVMPVFLRLENPLIVDMLQPQKMDARMGLIASKIEEAKQAGHDGLIMRNAKDSVDQDAPRSDVFVAFEPEQIKSAIGNRGTFDPADPRITFSLRSSKSAKVSEGTEGESNELPGDSEGSGQASNDASRSSDAGAIAAAVGGGAAAGAATAEGRILRQESATLRADGSIRAGRISTRAKPAKAGGLDAQTLQPVGASEFFDAAGLRGVVTAMPVADHAGLARRGAPASEYRLANLTYRLYGEEAPLTDAQLNNFQPNFRANGDFHAPLIWARVSQHTDGTWEVSMVQRIAGAEAPRGMSSKLYAAIEKDLGIRMSPSGLLSKQGFAMWQKRSPESVQWHQWSKHEQYYISPRRIKDNIARIGMDLADIAARPDSDPNKAQDHAIAMAERKELIKLWTKLPVEARAATPNMFSLRAYHGSPHDFDRFDISKIGTGEGSQVMGRGFYLPEDANVANYYKDLLNEQITIDGTALGLGGDHMMARTYAKMKAVGGLAALDRKLTQRQELLEIYNARRAERAAEGGDVSSFDAAILAAGEEIELIKRIKTAQVERKEVGRLYEVEVGVEPHQLMDWRKPLSEQGDTALKLRGIAARVGVNVEDDWDGGAFFRALEAKVGEENAGEAMKDGGVPGLRYPASADMSVGRDNLSHTLVIFDDRLIKITHKNGEPVTAAERQTVVDELFSLRAGRPSEQQRLLTQAAWSGTRQVFEDLLGDDLVRGRKHFDGEALAAFDRMVEDVRRVVQAVADGDAQAASLALTSALINANEIGRLAPGERANLYTQYVRSAARTQGVSSMRRDSAGDLYAIGQTDPIANLISIGVRGVEAEARRTGKSEAKIAVEAGRHEALEFFLAHGFISPKEWGALTAAARAENWIDETGIRKPYTDHYGEAVDSVRLEDIILKEAIAEKYGRYERGEYSPKGLIAQVFKRLKNLLDRIRNGIAGNGFQRWEDIFQKMDEGEMRRRYEARFGAPAAESKSRVTSKAVPADGVAALTIPKGAKGPAMAPGSPGPTPGLTQSAPGSLIDIQRELRRRLGLTVAAGRLDPKLALAAGQMDEKLMGQFDRQTEAIRLRTLEDIDTEAHEVAHALESRYPGLVALQQAYAAELSGVAALTGQTGLSEGFAEFFRLYLTNPQTIDSHAPGFRSVFEDALEAEDARALQDIQDIQAQYQEWRNASSAGRVIAAVKSGVPEKTWEKIRAEYDRGGLTRVGGMFWAYMESIYKSRIDKTNPIRALVGRIAQAAEASNQDIDLSAWRNPQMQAAKISASDGMSYADVTRGVSWANAAGRGSISLRDALATAFGGTAYEHWTPEQRDAFGAYLIARRGRWLWQRFEMDPSRNLGRTATAPANPSNGDWYFDTMRRVRRVYLRGRWESELTRAPDKHTRADHEQAILDLETANPQFSIAAQMVYQFNRDLALKRFQAGLDSQEEYDYKNGATDYVPWFRDMSDAIFAGTGASGRKVQQKFKLRGSYRDFINPVEGIIRQVYDTNREIAVNKPKLLLAQLADSVQGAGQYAEIIPATRMAVEEVKVRDALEAAGREQGLPPEDVKDMISAVAAMIGDDAVAKLFRSEQAGDGRDAVLHYMDAGVLKMLQIHDDERGIARDIIGFFETLNATPAADAFAGMLQAAVRIPQRAITASVGFMWRNMIRDAMQAKILQAGYWPVVSNIRTIASNRARANRGEETWGEILVRHGGIMGGFNRTDIQQAKAGRVLDLRSDAVTLRPWERQFWKQTVNPWHEDFWKWAEATEANTRQTIARISHKRALADAKMRYPAMHPDQQEFIALEAATQKSRDYMDYSRMGDAPSQMVFNRYLMFLNPYIQGMDKGLRAVFLAQTNEGRFAAAQLIRKKIAPLFNDDLQYQRLTKSEKDALKDAARIWLSISMIAVTHLLIEVNFNDPDDLEDRSNMERATSVSFTINGVHYRIPRGFDVLNLVSNGLRAAYESWWREDPTARERFLLSQAATQLPPLSNPMLDLFIGWKFSKNNFFNSDIEQRHMAGLLPEDRYSAYTSGLSRRIGEAVEMSPAMVEYTMTSVGADWARDLLRAYDVIDPSKPALKWQDYPFLRAARGLRSSHGAEEFWDLMGQDGEFLQVAGSYKDHAVDKRDWSRDDMRRFFDRRLKDDDARAFAVLHGHYDIEQRRLHPMIRAQEFAKGLSATMRDVASNRIDVPTFGKNEKRVEISREIRGQAMDIMAEINRREYRNALIALKRPGYENREPQPVKPYLEELKAISPEIHKTLMGKLTTSKGPNVYDYDRVRESWPDTRAKLLARDKKETIIERQGDIEFNDLKARVQGAKALGVH